MDWVHTTQDNGPQFDYTNMSMVHQPSLAGLKTQCMVSAHRYPCFSLKPSDDLFFGGVLPIQS